jgi:hypothetical protein
MKQAAISLSLVASYAAASDSGVTPIQKVLTMLDAMVKNGKEAKHTEEVEFASYQQWCDSVRGEKDRSIASGGASIEQLEADIAKASSDAAVLGEEIAALQAAVAQMSEEGKSAKAIRDKERADYEVAHADLSESVDACERAVQVLKTRSADVPQSLIQLKATVAMTAHEQGIIDSFLGVEQAPQANAYEFQSGSVVGLLEKLTMKFQDERLALEKAELSARGNYEVLMQRLHDNTEASTESESEKTAAKAQRIEDKASAENDLSMTQKVKGMDEKALSDTLAECHLKSAAFEKDQVTRSEEVKALEKAIEIIGSEDVSGAGDKHLPSALMQGAAVLAQLRSQNSGAAQVQAAAYLKTAAARIGSRYLSVMASHVSEDPFIKVKAMIKDLITKLMEQANDEADHHSYCQAELATNKATRENKAAETEALTAEVEKLTAQASQLGAEITKLADDITDIFAQQAQATELRNEEKAVNTKTIAEAQGAQEAVEKATKVLRDFYAKAAEASFVQMQSKDKDPYGGMQGDSSGIFGMLEVILSDFARLESETSSAEDQAASSYKTFMNESTEDKAVKEVEKEHKEGNKRNTEDQNLKSKKQLSQTQDELDAAVDYAATLKADCLDTGLSYEERKQRRAEEIQSLQEAMKMLENGI